METFTLRERDEQRQCNSGGETERALNTIEVEERRRTFTVLKRCLHRQPAGENLGEGGALTTFSFSFSVDCEKNSFHKQVWFVSVW